MGRAQEDVVQPCARESAREADHAGEVKHQVREGRERERRDAASEDADAAGQMPSDAFGRGLDAGVSGLVGFTSHDSPRYTIAVTIQEPSIVERLQRELAVVGNPVPTTALRALVGAERGHVLPAERLGRVLGYERESLLRTRRPPRVALALTPDGRPATPQHLTDGNWRMVRRILTPDAARGQAASLGVRLCDRARELPQARELLRPHIEAAARTAFESQATDLLVADPAWEDLYRRFLTAQPHGIGAYTAQQRDAEQALEAEQLSGLARYFGVDEPTATARALSTLRAPLPGEHGEALDDLVRRRAGDPAIAREVLAFIEEWGLLVDRLEREPTLADYIERWSLSEGEAKTRLSLFRRVFPDERDPTALWRLLWEAVPAAGAGGNAFVRLTSQPLVASPELPTLTAYFLASVYEQVAKPLALQLKAAGLQPRDESQETSRDLRRLYALANRATHTWVRVALRHGVPHPEAMLLGLASVESIHDNESAAIVEHQLSSYRGRTAERKPRDVMLRVQNCLRVCADLDLLDPPSAITPLLPGVRSAAGALAALAANGAVNIVAETEETMSILYATV